MPQGSVNGLRQWAFQPNTYEPLAAEESGEAEPLSAVSASDSSGSSGRRSSSITAFLEKPLMGGTSSSGGTGSGVASTVLAVVHALLLLPTLAVRCAHLGWLLATEPIRRRHHHYARIGLAPPSWWPASVGSAGKLSSLRVLVPSFLQPSDGGAERRLHPTAWLDGLRGVSAFFVVWHHCSLLWFGWHIHSGYGSNDNEHWLIQLPIVRLLVSGPPNVAVFFVISGYALSYKPLRLARLRRFAEAGEAIHSAVFRRHMRLFLMPLVTTLLAALMAYYGYFGDNRDWTRHGVAIPSRYPYKGKTLFDQLRDWWEGFVGISNPISKDLRRGAGFSYDQNLWTLPVEFDCSMAVFLCQAGLLRVRARVRLLVMLGFVAYTMKYMHWQYFLFFAGMFLCDLKLELDGVAPAPAAPAAPTAPTATPAMTADASAVLLSAPTPSSSTRRRTLLGTIFFLLSLFLLSTPQTGRGADKSTGYVMLIKWIPKLHSERHNGDYFWVPIAAALLVLSIDRTPALQRLFSRGLPQYLGRISYSLYLVHGPLLWSLGHWLVRHAVAVTGGLGEKTDDKDKSDPNAPGTQLRYGLGVGVSAVLLWIALIFFADLGMRTVDVHAVRLGHMLYKRLGQKEPEKETVLPRTA